jgi:hypothetical protein
LVIYSLRMSTAVVIDSMDKLSRTVVRHTIGLAKCHTLGLTRGVIMARSSNPPTSGEWKHGSANAFSCRFLTFETAVLVSGQLECCQERGFENAHGVTLWKPPPRWPNMANRWPARRTDMTEGSTEIQDPLLRAPCAAGARNICVGFADVTRASAWIWRICHAIVTRKIRVRCASCSPRTSREWSLKSTLFSLFLQFSVIWSWKSTSFP